MNKLKSTYNNSKISKNKWMFADTYALFSTHSFHLFIHEKVDFNQYCNNEALYYNNGDRIIISVLTIAIVGAMIVKVASVIAIMGAMITITVLIIALTAPAKSKFQQLLRLLHPKFCFVCPLLQSLHPTSLNVHPVLQYRASLLQY